MQKPKLFKSGWEKIDAPEWFPDYINSIDDTNRLGLLYRALVLREPGFTSLTYQCQSCNHIFNSAKIHEEVAGCVNCNSTNLISCVKRPTPKPYEVRDLKDLMSNVTTNLASLRSLYTGKMPIIDVKDFGFTKTGYYFQLTGGDSVKVEGPSLRTAILKAAVICPFLWDFDFDWEKVGVRKLKIHNILSILE